MHSITWHVTAVHGRDPINAPSMQSVIDTPQTPHAMLIPDQGTTPMRRSTDRRTHAEDRGFADLPDVSRSGSESPSRALRVMSKARGKKCVKKGERGVASNVAHAEPIMVRVVRRTVAYAGEKSAPAKTFCGHSEYTKVRGIYVSRYLPIKRCLELTRHASRWR